MRVLHVDPERGFGGGEVQVVALLRELGVRGHEATVVAHPDGGLAREASRLGLDVRPLRVRNHLDVAAALALGRLVHGHQVVHFHTARAHALAPLCRRDGVRLVVTRRMDYVPRGGPWTRYLYNRAVDVVVAISEGVRCALLEGGVRPERIRVVPSGVDPARVEAPPGSRERLRGAWGVGADDVLVLVAGALVRRKGHDVLLEAARMIAGPGERLRYVFCGAGPEATRLAAAATPLGRRVRLAGHRDDIGACLAAADVVALPSRHEGLGVAALEAMAAGRPVVASGVGGLAEVVVDEATGLLVPAGDATALGQALLRLAREPALRARLGAAGRARVHEHYSVARMAEGTLACYESPPCA